MEDVKRVPKKNCIQKFESYRLVVVKNCLVVERCWWRVLKYFFCFSLLFVHEGNIEVWNPLSVWYKNLFQKKK